MWFLNKKKIGRWLLIAGLTAAHVAASQPVSLEMENVNLRDALRIFAKFMDLNLIVSPRIKGSVSLHLHDASEQQAFNLLLDSQGLVRERMGNVSFITSYGDMIKHQEDLLRLKEATNASATLITQTWQIRYAKADDIAHLLQDATASLLSRRGHVRVDSRTNIICVQDLAENIAAVKALIKKWDIPVRQVLIEARLASVDCDYERQLGIHFSVHNPALGGPPHTITDTAVLATRFSLAVATLADGSLLDIALAAMENQGHGDLISKPSLFTANQQTAVIESGEEIPYQEVSLSGGTGIAFKKAVLSLKVTPQIMPGNKVLLQLNVNQDRPSSRIVLGVPAITTRQISTNVLVNNGQTLVLGGIYELNKEFDEQRIPFLGKIPLVGELFRQQNIKENKRELLIFVTPKIIS